MIKKKIYTFFFSHFVAFDLSGPVALASIPHSPEIQNRIKLESKPFNLFSFRFASFCSRTVAWQRFGCDYCVVLVGMLLNFCINWKTESIASSNRIAYVVSFSLLRPLTGVRCVSVWAREGTFPCAGNRSNCYFDANICTRKHAEARRDQLIEQSKCVWHSLDNSYCNRRTGCATAANTFQ